MGGLPFLEFGMFWVLLNVILDRNSFIIVLLMVPFKEVFSSYLLLLFFIPRFSRFRPPTPRLSNFVLVFATRIRNV